MRFKIFSATEHSDSIPLDVVSPVEELRKFHAGQIDDAQYVRALERGDEALTDGWSTGQAGSDVAPDATPSVA